MRSNHLIYTIFILILNSNRNFGQLNNELGIAKHKISIGLSTQFYIGQKESNFNLSLCLGLMSHQKAVLVHTQIFYNLYFGGLGTSTLANEKLPFFNISNSMWDIAIAPGITFGTGREPIVTFIRPFNHMSTPAAYHNYSASLSLTHVFVINKYKKKKKVGSININLGRLSLGYFNDVMDNIFAWEGLGMGDNHDRWWTGGGFLNYRIDLYNEFFYEFDRFTGFGGKLFEISNKLRLTNLFYPSDSINDITEIENVYKNQLFFNRGLISVGFRGYNSEYQNFYLKISLMGDNKYDVQNFIHSKISHNPIHNTQTIDLYQLSYGLNYLINKISLNN